MKTCNHLRKRLCLLLCVCILLIMSACQKPAPKQSPVTEEQLPEISYDTLREWTPIYHHHECGIFASFAPYIGAKKELTQEDIHKILPAKPLPFEVQSGEAWFDDNRSAIYVSLSIITPEGGVTVTMGQWTILLGCCTSFDPDVEASLCGDVEYRLYESENVNGRTLIAKTMLQDVPMMARTMSGKQDFEAVLECFSWYPDGKPDFSRIVLEN